MTERVSIGFPSSYVQCDVLQTLNDGDQMVGVQLTLRCPHPHETKLELFGHDPHPPIARHDRTILLVRTGKGERGAEVRPVIAWRTASMHSESER